MTINHSWFDAAAKPQAYVSYDLGGEVRAYRLHIPLSNTQLDILLGMYYYRDHGPRTIEFLQGFYGHEPYHNDDIVVLHEQGYIKYRDRAGSRLWSITKFGKEKANIYLKRLQPTTYGRI